MTELEQAILEAAQPGRGAKEIAEACHCSPQTVRRVLGAKSRALAKLAGAKRRSQWMFVGDMTDEEWRILMALTGAKENE